MPYRFGPPPGVTQQIGGVAGAMFNPWIDRAKALYSGYQGMVDDAYNWGIQPVGGPEGYVPPVQAPPMHPPMQPTPNLNPYQEPVQSQVNIPPTLPAPQPTGVQPRLSDATQPLPDAQMPGMGPGMQPPPMVPEMVVPQGPSPMETWMTDYNDETARAQEAMRKATRAQSFIDMGSALLEAPDWASGISGMGQAAGGIGAGRVQREAYGQDRESNKLDSLYRMEQIRASQDPRRGQARPTVLQDGTVIQYINGQPHRVLPGGVKEPIDPAELGGMYEGAEDAERAELADAKDQRKHDAWVREAEQAKQKGGGYYDYWKQQPENVEPRNPGGAIGPQTGGLAQTQAEEIRAGIRANPKMMASPEVGKYLNMGDEELIELFGRRNDPL